VPPTCPASGGGGTYAPFLLEDLNYWSLPGAFVVQLLNAAGTAFLGGRAVLAVAVLSLHSSSIFQPCPVNGDYCRAGTKRCQGDSQSNLPGRLLL
uniref:Uncharacterized protein n=1 Tax=Varanus komodoensis TaxID=61221 RepID=A0A8D2LSB3_VARKO